MQPLWRRPAKLPAGAHMVRTRRRCRQPIRAADLGELYPEGLGVTKDPVRAYAWLALSARSGDTRAAEARDGIAAELTLDQLSRGEELARQELAAIANKATAKNVAYDRWIHAAPPQGVGRGDAIQSARQRYNLPCCAKTGLNRGPRLSAPASQ
jgi:TPR repeat protein